MIGRRDPRSSTPRALSLLGLAALLNLACGEAQPPPATPTAPTASPSVAPPDAPALPPRTAEEQAVATELEEELRLLLALGERSFADDGMMLAGVTDHVAARLEGFGYEVQRRGFTQGEQVAQNLEAEVPGLRRGNQLIVVGARLDANTGSAGADDNASGVAALLVLAERFHDQRALRTLRFVFFSSAGPRSQRGAQGALHYATFLESGDKEVSAVVELHGLGRFDGNLDSQRYPDSVPALGSRGDFIALVSQPEAAAMADPVAETFAGQATLPVTRWLLLRDDAFLTGSGALEFIERGFPTLLVTDTMGLRFGDFGGATDVATGLDLDRMARVVTALGPALQTLTGPRGEAPTPSPDGLAPGTPGP